MLLARSWLPTWVCLIRQVGGVEWQGCGHACNEASTSGLTEAWRPLCHTLISYFSRLTEDSLHFRRPPPALPQSFHRLHTARICLLVLSPTLGLRISKNNKTYATAPNAESTTRMIYNILDSIVDKAAPSRDTAAVSEGAESWGW